MKLSILIFLIIFSSNAIAEDVVKKSVFDYDKSIFQKLENSKKPVIGNLEKVTAKGTIISFGIYGVVVLTGRAKYLTAKNKILQLTIPEHLWKKVSHFLKRRSNITYIKSNGININIDLPLELLSIDD